MNFGISNKSVGEFSDLLKKCKPDELASMKAEVEADSRSGIKSAYKKAVAAANKQKDEIARTTKLYEFEESIAGMPGCSILGLDEVGRGPVAGPLTVGGAVLQRAPQILNLNDSKKLTATQRDDLSKTIKSQAIAAKTVSVEPSLIDKHGMSDCLRYAFREVVNQVENDGIKVDVILLDGNPLHFDPREVNVIKGDAKCASIGAASIIAKVERDNYMEKISAKYPKYCFAQNKGYGTAQHIEAIKKYGLTPIHRKTFCTSFMQMSLF